MWKNAEDVLREHEPIDEVVARVVRKHLPYLVDQLKTELEEVYFQTMGFLEGIGCSDEVLKNDEDTVRGVQDYLAAKVIIGATEALKNALG